MVLLLCKTEGRRAMLYGWKKAEAYSGKEAGRQLVRNGVRARDKKEARTCEPARIPFLLNQVDDRPLRTRSSIEKAFGGRS